jgi:hypothetical protein
VNGKKQPVDSRPGSYFTLAREWRDGDTVSIQMPMRLHTEFLPGTTNEVAVLYGPVVLAGELGTNAMPSPYVRVQTELSRLPVPSAPMFATTADELLKHIQLVSGQPLTFRTRGIGRPQDVTLIPFYQLHLQRYSVYWKLISEAEWKAHAAEIAAANARRMAEEARVVDVVHPGEEQSETDHHLQGNGTQSGDYYGSKWRHSSDWFSYDVKVLPDQPVLLDCTFLGSDSGAREFDILVDGKMIATQKLDGRRGGGLYDATFPIPAELTKGKDKVTVKFAAHPGNLAGGLFGLRVLKLK